MATALRFVTIVRTARDAAELFAPLFEGQAAEKVVVAHLGPDRALLHVQESDGGAADAPLPIRAIVADALACGAAGLIVAHNHPSGDPQPSSSDLAATRLLAETAASLGIALHDHLVFAGGECRSFRDLGLI